MCCKLIIEHKGRLMICSQINFHLIFTARQRNCRKVNVFTGDCHLSWGGGGACMAQAVHAPLGNARQPRLVPHTPATPQPYGCTVGKRAVRNLLECCLVYFKFHCNYITLSVTKYAPTSHLNFLSKMYPHVLRELGPILSHDLISEHVISSMYAGSKFGEQLLKGKANFTIIDQRNFMHDNIHATQAAVIPGRLKPLVQTFSFANFCSGSQRRNRV